jgi:hypothetical protein
MFADVDIVCDGAMESTDRFYDEILMRDFLDSEIEMAQEDGLPIQIYVTFHEHSDHDEEMDGCECIQYVTDGRPKYVFNMGDEKGSWQ